MGWSHADVYFIKTKETKDDMIELFITRGNNLSQLAVHKSLPWPNKFANDGFFAIRPPDRGRDADIYYFHIKNSASGYARLETLTASSDYQTGQAFKLPWTCEEVANGDLVVKEQGGSSQVQLILPDSGLSPHMKGLFNSADLPPPAWLSISGTDHFDLTKPHGPLPSSYHILTPWGIKDASMGHFKHLWYGHSTLYLVKSRGNDSGHVEMQEFNVQTQKVSAEQTVFPLSDDANGIFVPEFWTRDLYYIKSKGTSSEKLEFHCNVREGQGFLGFGKTYTRVEHNQSWFNVNDVNLGQFFMGAGYHGGERG